MEPRTTIQRAHILDVIKTLSQFRGAPKYMLLLGAGAPASSGVPLAADLVIDLLRVEYCAKKKVRFRDARLQPESRIRAWAMKALPWFDPFDCNSSEYEQVMTNVLRLPDARNEFLRGKLAKAKPSKGYRRLGSLISKGVFTTIWSTNFGSEQEYVRQPGFIGFLWLGPSGLIRVRRQWK